jgi:rsbT co-antagonist protein RsbR
MPSAPPGLASLSGLREARAALLEALCASGVDAAAAGRLLDLVLGALGGGGARPIVLPEDARESTAIADEVLATIPALRRVLTQKARALAATPEEALAALEAIGEACDALVEASRPLIRHAAARMELFYRRTPALMYVVDADMRFQHMSDHFLQVMGYAREELLGTRSTNLAEPASLERSRKIHLPQVQREGIVIDAPLRFFKKSGEIVDTLLSSVALRTEDGTMQLLLTVLVDVTERLRAEQALRESQERYRAIVELAPFGVLVHRAGRIVYINPAGARIAAGGDTAAMLGRDVMELVLPEDRAKVAARIRSTYGEGEAVPPIEEKFYRLDGTPYVAEVAARPVIFEGAPAVQVVFTDITARRNAEEAERRAIAQEQTIRAQEELLRALSAPLIPLDDGVVAMPLVGRVTAERAARILEVLAQGVVEQGAEVAILDVTGVPEADEATVDALVRAARSIRLLGADVVLTGVKPSIARTLLALGADLGGVATRATLREGIRHAALRRAHVRAAPAGKLAERGRAR